jgi:hypothetical protein
MLPKQQTSYTETMEPSCQAVRSVLWTVMAFAGGKGWAEKVLRKEDMQIYMLRLLLEYARLCDDNRNTLGYVRDLEG